jgi:Zn-finger protein
MNISAHDQLAGVIEDLQRKLADLEAVNERLRSNIVALFKRAKAEGVRCKYCAAPVYFLIHQDTGKRGIYDPDGSSHWGTCPNAMQAQQDIEARKKAALR